MPVNDSTIKKSALALLARREHARAELKQKLMHKGFPESEVNAVLEDVMQSNLQSDVRFVEMFVRSRAARGYGPVKIIMELKERGIDDNLISSSIDDRSQEWFDLAKSVYCKKFGKTATKFLNPKNRMKQQRFLHGRGFNFDQIKECFSD